MPGVTMPGFKELADVIAGLGSTAPGTNLRIVQEQIRYWKIESLQGLNELDGRRRRRSWAFRLVSSESRSTWKTGAKSKTFSSRSCSNREFAME